MRYVMFSLRSDHEDAKPIDDYSETGIKLKAVGVFNRKMKLYLVEGEAEYVDDALNKLKEDPHYLLSELDSGDVPFEPSSSSIWLWKQIILHQAEQLPNTPTH